MKLYFLTAVILLGLFMGVTWYVDPFFHYHNPFAGMSVVINDARFQGDGMLRNAEYNTVIVGNSIAGNFRTSAYESLFDGEALKISYSGANFAELHKYMSRAFRNHSMKKVVQLLDVMSFISGKDQIVWDGDIDYLLNDNPFDDARYLLNKSIFINYVIPDIIGTSAGEKTIEKDDWFLWTEDNAGFESNRPIARVEQEGISDVQETMVRENITWNLLQSAKDHPETEFVYLLPPMSIAHWEHKAEQGELRAAVDALRIGASILTEQENIRLYSWLDDWEVITEPENYCDSTHFSRQTCTKMLEDIAGDKETLGAEACDAYFEVFYEGLERELFEE